MELYSVKRALSVRKMLFLANKSAAPPQAILREKRHFIVPSNSYMSIPCQKGKGIIGTIFSCQEVFFNLAHSLQL